MKCASCDIDLSSDPMMVDGEPFCCQGCAEGGPCNCTYENEQDRWPRNGQRDPWLVPDLFEDAS